MKFKIISDGTDKGTRVVVADTGEIVSGITSIKWEIDKEFPLARCELKLYGVAVDAIIPTSESDK